jgi:hypothetical protein
MSTNGCEDRWTIVKEAPTVPTNLRDYFAAHAPEAVPSWFLKMHKPDLKFDSFSFGEINQATKECFFRWRYFYADQMLAERSKQS